MLHTDAKGCHDVLRQDCTMPALQCAGALLLTTQSKQLYALSTKIVQQPLALACMQLVYVRT